MKDEETSSRRFLFSAVVRMGEPQRPQNDEYSFRAPFRSFSLRSAEASDSRPGNSASFCVHVGSVFTRKRQKEQCTSGESLEHSLLTPRSQS